jgi:hypothetical protein
LHAGGHAAGTSHLDNGCHLQAARVDHAQPLADIWIVKRIEATHRRFETRIGYAAAQGGLDIDGLDSSVQGSSTRWPRNVPTELLADRREVGDTATGRNPR